MSIKLPKLKKVDFNKEKKKKILLLSDDLRLHSGVGTMSREIVYNTCHKYDWVQIGGAIKHPDKGKRIDVSEEVRSKTEVSDASVVVYPFDGYGNAEILRHLIQTEKPDAIMHFTDPRFWGWLWEIENEIRSVASLVYYHVWDNYPYPKFNKPFYDSNDVVCTISKVTDDIVRTVAPSVEAYHIPHAVDNNIFSKKEDAELAEFKKELIQSSFFD